MSGVVSTHRTELILNLARMTSALTSEPFPLGRLVLMSIVWLSFAFARVYRPAERDTRRGRVSTLRRPALADYRRVSNAYAIFSFSAESHRILLWNIVLSEFVLHKNKNYLSIEGFECFENKLHLKRTVSGVVGLSVFFDSGGRWRRRAPCERSVH